MTTARGDELTILAGGDVEWSRFLRRSGTIMTSFASGSGTIPIPLVNRPEAREHALKSRFAGDVTFEEEHYACSIPLDLQFTSEVEGMRHPLQRIARLFREADVGFANLEMPLSRRARFRGAFRGNPRFADALAWAGVNVVSIANNHTLDAEGNGLDDTIAALEKAGVASVGAGKTLRAACRPLVLERKGTRVAFLAYSQWSGIEGPSAFARNDASGVAPLDPELVCKDVARARRTADVVIVSAHWGSENEKVVDPAIRRFAHAIIEAGADVILGHHPHLPQGVELHQGKPIFYSLGNLLFGHAHDYWTDNVLLRLSIRRKGLARAELLPIAGAGAEVAQPYLLRGPRARDLLTRIRMRSAELDTTIDIEGALGRVHL